MGDNLRDVVTRVFGCRLWDFEVPMKIFQTPFKLAAINFSCHFIGFFRHV